VHNVVQFVDCLTQGKGGPGFDISAAVFGGQLYTRFNPAVLLLMDDSVRPGSPPSPLIWLFSYLYPLFCWQLGS
jgi:hypothetical protein